MPQLTKCSHEHGPTLQKKIRCWRTVLKLWPVCFGALEEECSKSQPNIRKEERRPFAPLLTFSRLSALSREGSSSTGHCIHLQFRASLSPLSSPGLQRGFSIKQHSADNLWHFSWWHFLLCWHTLKGKEVAPQSSTLWLKSTSLCFYSPLQMKPHSCLLRPLEFNSLMLGSAQMIPSSSSGMLWLTCISNINSNENQ